jgi:lipopolysaccharide/colanic/teichoic acid biosynthesis glycosyltransferase
MQALLSRVGDLLIAVAVIVFTLPLMAFVALAIRLDSKGPVFSWQPRLGRDGRRFFAIKFRTTEYDPGRHSRVMWDRGARETRIGSALHYTRFDDLPTLLNVLAGDLQIIGNERAESPDLRRLAKWAAWAATAVAFEVVG